MPRAGCSSWYLVVLIYSVSHRHFGRGLSGNSQIVFGCAVALIFVASSVVVERRVVGLETV